MHVSSNEIKDGPRIGDIEDTPDYLDDCLDNMIHAQRAYRCCNT